MSPWSPLGPDLPPRPESGTVSRGGLREFLRSVGLSNPDIVSVEFFPTSYAVTRVVRDENGRPSWPVYGTGPATVREEFLYQPKEENEGWMVFDGGSG